MSEARLVPVFNRLDQCAGKRRYKRRRDAIKAKRQVQTAWAGVHLVAYPCPHCATSDGRPWWHLGNNRDEEPQRGYVERW